MTYGLLYGVQTPPDNIESLLEEYQAAQRDVIASLAKEASCEHWEAADHVVPDWETASDPSVLGFFIAAGASGREGVPYLKTFRLDAVGEDDDYNEAMRAAQPAWDSFAQWCADKGIVLPEPAVWLTETEVA
jgi:hypothetical protein